MSCLDFRVLTNRALINLILGPIDPLTNEVFVFFILRSTRSIIRFGPWWQSSRGFDRG